MAMYDLLIVGAGLYGAVFAREACDAGRKVLVIDRRGHVGGNVYTESVGGIPVHRYGAHIFHTDDEEVMRYAQRFADFTPYVHSPLARYGNELYSLPFNMNTFREMWGVSSPEEARSVIEAQRREITGTPEDLEEQAISLVGRDVYEKLIKGYTEKQWGRPCRELPAFIIRRIPVRFTYDNNYFNDRFQGIPADGYTPMIEKLLAGADVRLDTDWTELRKDPPAERVLYTGPIDAYFDHRFGPLEYRSLRFETEDLEGVTDLQGRAVINETSASVPYTRVIEHKHFAPGRPDIAALPHTVVTREYSKTWQPGDEPYYPVNDEKNDALYRRYLKLAEKEENVLFGGRLGLYRYLDMDDTIRLALDQARAFLSESR